MFDTCRVNLLNDHYPCPPLWHPAVLKKRRTFTESPRPRPPLMHPTCPRPATYVEPTQMMYPFPTNPMTTTRSAPFPSFRTDALWLNRPTQPLRIRKTAPAPQTTPWMKGSSSPLSSHSSSSYVVSNSPVLPIGGAITLRSTTPRTGKYAGEMATASPATPPALPLPSLQLGLDKLISNFESDFVRSRRTSQPLSVATSLSVYSQASASDGRRSPPQRGERDSMEAAEKVDDDATDAYSIRSAETIQVAISPRPSADVAIFFDIDPRLSAAPSTATDTTTSTAGTLVEPHPPLAEKRRLERTRLSLQPCPSLASANSILRRADLPPDHDAPSPVDENTYRRYEYASEFAPEDKAGAAPPAALVDDDICADYDYIRAIDILIYGERPLPDVPVDVVRRSSRTRPRRELAPVRRRVSDKRAPPTGKRLTTTQMAVAATCKPRTRRGNFKQETKNASRGSKAETRPGVRESERRSIFFQVTHFFGKSSSS